MTLYNVIQCTSARSLYYIRQYKATCFDYNLVIFRPKLTFVLPDGNTLVVPILINNNNIIIFHAEPHAKCPLALSDFSQHLKESTNSN